MKPENPERSSLPARRAWPVHPFLWAIFPVVSLHASNLGWVSLRELWIPVAFMLTVAGCFWGLLRWLVPDRHARAMALSLFWIPFFSYGAMVDAFRRHTGFEQMLSGIQLTACVVLAGLAVCCAVRALGRRSWAWAGWTPILNGAAAIALALALGTLGYNAWRQQAERVVSAGRPLDLPQPSKPVPSASKPDIYFIICDSYPRADYLRDYFAFDNKPFLDALRGRGFYVADESVSNYPRTMFSVPSILNMDYLSPEVLPANPDAFSPECGALIQQSKVEGLLRREGYEIVSFATGTGFTDLKSADRLLGAKTYLTYFHKVLADMTPLRSILKRVVSDRIWVSGFPDLLDRLETLERGSRPLFAYAHLMAPHAPHYFDGQGRYRDAPVSYERGWRETTEYLNRRVLQVIDTILKKNPNSAFILQADHGACTYHTIKLGYIVADWEGGREDYLRDSSAILNAYYFPRGGYDALYPAISPVNSFRMLFNRLLGYDWPRLSDTAYVFRPGDMKLVPSNEIEFPHQRRTSAGRAHAAPIAAH